MWNHVDHCTEGQTDGLSDNDNTTRYRDLDLELGGLGGRLILWRCGEGYVTTVGPM